MKIDVDKSSCIGAGNCVEVAPQLFAQEDKSGIVVALADEVPEGQDETAQLAADVCPVAAIMFAEK